MGLGGFSSYGELDPQALLLLLPPLAPEALLWWTRVERRKVKAAET